MGMDISGGMIVGERGDLLAEPENYESGFCEWAEEVGFESMPEHYDADPERIYYGFPVPDITVEDLGIDWVMEIKQLGKKFEELTGVKAKLIGTQDVW